MTRRSGFPPGAPILIAAVAGALAGAVAVYVRVGLSGNTLPERPPAVVDDADIAACAAKADLARRTADAATGAVAAMLPADPPQSLKSLAFNAPDGKPMTLADRAGKTLLVNLWATWCYPCREEMPALNTLQKEMGGDKFEVVAVNVDTGDDTKPRKFLAETGVDALAYYRDPTLDLFNELKTPRSGSRAAGDAAGRCRRLPARPHERPGGLGERGREAIPERRGGRMTTAWLAIIARERR